MAKTYKFKDYTVPASTELGRALEAKDMKLAEKLYKQLESDFKKRYKDFDVSQFSGAVLNAAFKKDD